MWLVIVDSKMYVESGKWSPLELIINVYGLTRDTTPLPNSRLSDQELHLQEMDSPV